MNGTKKSIPSARDTRQVTSSGSLSSFCNVRTQMSIFIYFTKVVERKLKKKSKLNFSAPAADKR
jgi:hypothetical protein